MQATIQSPVIEQISEQTTNAMQGSRRDALPPAVSIAHVAKTYPTPLLKLKQLFRRSVALPVEALRDVSFDVRAGEIFGLIGRNGAGKTTLTKIIATLVQPTSGKVTVCGADSVRDEGQVRASIGLAAAEERSFYWRLTIEQNLLFFARTYGMSDRAARSRIAELLVLFELEPNARRRFGELSTGNKQRMAIARAILSKPPVLLLDEPTRSLDPIASASMRKLIRSLADGTSGEAPTTILLTSHNLSEIEELCPRVGVISRGQIRALDTPQNLRALQQSRERVRLTVRDTDAAHVERLFAPDFADFRFESATTDATLAFSFTRHANDDQLDCALRLLHKGGASVVACDTERATLLDVLEAFEQEEGEEAKQEG